MIYMAYWKIFGAILTQYGIRHDISLQDVIHSRLEDTSHMSD